MPVNGRRNRVEDQTMRLASGRTVGFADYGIPDVTAVLWCHGGPGSRLEPAYLRRAASQAGLRLIGIDRPGYGLSAPQPGRTIAGWVPEALAVADHLGIGLTGASGLVDRLVRQDLLTRETDPTERRRIRLSVTAQGKARRDAAVVSTRSSMTAALESLTPDEAATVDEAMTILRAQFGESR